MKRINTIVIAGLSFFMFGCTPDENKAGRNIDQLVTVILTDGTYYIIPLEKDGNNSNSWTAHYAKNKYKKVSGSPEQIAKQIYGNEKVKEARWTSK